MHKEVIQLNEVLFTRPSGIIFVLICGKISLNLLVVKWNSDESYNILSAFSHYFFGL